MLLTIYSLAKSCFKSCSVKKKTFKKSWTWI